MGQIASHNRAWRTTFRAAALSSASFLVIAALTADDALSAGPGPGMQLAQGTGGGNRPAGGGNQQRQPPQKDLTDPNQKWNSQDIANAEKLSASLRDLSKNLEAMGEHFTQIGQPGMVSWTKAMLDYLSTILHALQGNA